MDPNLDLHGSDAQSEMAVLDTYFSSMSISNSDPDPDPTWIKYENTFICLCGQ